MGTYSFNFSIKYNDIQIDLKFPSNNPLEKFKYEKWLQSKIELSLASLTIY